jgi:hypothetical protein
MSSDENKQVQNVKKSVEISHRRLNNEYYSRSRYSLVVWCWGTSCGWPEVRVPAGAGNFSFHHRVQTGSGAHIASYPVGTRISFPGSKAAEA